MIFVPVPNGDVAVAPLGAWMKPPPVMFTFVVTPGLVPAVVPVGYSAARVAAAGATLLIFAFVALKTAPVVAVPANGAVDGARKFT